jgi:hypothetical protein
MARYIRSTVNIPAEFEECLQKRIAEAGYDSISSYFLGLFLFDIKSRREHSWTAKLLSQPPKVRDDAFRQLAAEFAKGTASEKPGWFDKFVRELVEAELKKSGGPVK